MDEMLGLLWIAEKALPLSDIEPSFCNIFFVGNLESFFVYYIEEGLVNKKIGFRRHFSLDIYFMIG